MVQEKVFKVIRNLLEIDLHHNAKRLGYITFEPNDIDEALLYDSIDLLNFLSTQKDDFSRKRLIAVSALLWYYNRKWNGLNNYLILFLSRCGFGPSSIMVDDKYDHQEQTFSASSSLLNQFAVSLNLLQYEVVLKENRVLLSEFQKNIWYQIDEHQLLGISAPTSAGKSFVILLKAIDLLLKNHGQVIYIVPTLSLVSQVARDFRIKLNEYALYEYEVDTSYNVNKSDGKKIYVLTQEKAISAFTQTEIPFKNIRLLVIDEIQNIERVADWEDHRAKILFDLILEIRQACTIDHIIISGPRINEIDKLGQELFEINSKKTETASSPVMSITYSISKEKISNRNKFFFNLYSDLLDNPLRVPIPSGEEIKGYGQQMYTESFLNYLVHFIERVGSQTKNLIFSPTSKISREIAEEIIKNRKEVNDEFLQGLSEYLTKTVHKNFSLANTVKFGVAYHNGKLPAHVRIVIEDSIRNQKITNISCTTTLLQGVNLPVQNIFLRNPDLFVKAGADGSKPKLSGYEIANLRGRAGRLLKDFIGRTYALDESGFSNDDEGSSNTNLSEDSSKTLKVGYKDKFEQYKNEIRQELQSNYGHTSGNREYSYLTTYIRQTIYRNPDTAITHLTKVGITLNQEEVTRILRDMEALNIPRKVCASNRYWDPYDLAIIKNDMHLVNTPLHPFEDSIVAKLESMLKFFKDRLPTYYKYYFGIEEVPGKEILRAKCITIDNWIKEKFLAEILDFPYYDSAEKIEETITFLQNKVSFGLPMMLKPLYDLKHEDQMFTRFIEMGAYSPLVRRLIEFNIPRETAIMLAREYKIDFSDDRILLQEIRKISNQLGHWYKVQLEAL